MNAALENLYVGPLKNVSPPGVGVPPAGGDAMPASELVNAECLAKQLARFATRYSHDDRRAAASVWSKWHFSVLIPTALASNLLLDYDLPLGLEDAHLEFAPGGQTQGLWLTHAGKPLTSRDAFTRFTTLIDGHLTPLITALADYSGASPRVFWSNAGTSFEHFTEALQAHPLAGPDTIAPARQLLASRHLPDGRRNPLFQPIRYLENATGEASERRRRLCCIRYLIPELKYCSTCPLKQANVGR